LHKPPRYDGDYLAVVGKKVLFLPNVLMKRPQRLITFAGREYRETLGLRIDVKNKRPVRGISVVPPGLRRLVGERFTRREKQQ
jgi:hypothetical protein